MTASAGGTNATFGAEAENENAIHRGVNTSHSKAIRPIVRSVTVGAKNGEPSAGHDVTSRFEQSFPCLRMRPFSGSGFFGYLSLEVWPVRQARNTASACSRSSALLNLRRGCFGGSAATSGILPLTSSTPCRFIRPRSRHRSGKPAYKTHPAPPNVKNEKEKNI